MIEHTSSESDWKLKLTPEQFNVCRLKGTEHAFTGKYHDTKASGRYHCVCCDTPLFTSEVKYDSGTGWPSFWESLPGAVKTHHDTTYGMSRTEVLCAKCDAHLGHVFEDGPPPTGQRFCINSIALQHHPVPQSSV